MVAISPRTYRQQRITQIEQEIESIRRDHLWMPLCCAQEAHDEIDEKRAQIKRLEEPHFFEKPVGQTLAQITGGVISAVGLLLQSYGTFTFGVFILILSALGAIRAPKK